MPSRRDIAARLNAIRPRRGASVGTGSWIDPRAHIIGRGTSLGARVTIYRGTEILGPVTVGDRTFINRDVYIRPQTTIGPNIDIGPFSRFITDSHEPGSPTRRAGTQHFRPITVGAGAWIGASVTVLGGVTIGGGAVIAAGSVVTDDVEAHALYAGVPARKKRDLSAA